MEAIIKVQNLKKSFKQYKKEPGLKGTLKGIFKRQFFEVNAVNDISFEIEPGEFVGFIGPNGAGKTTTLKMLSGILYPSSGEISVAGHIPQKRETQFLKSISLVMGQKSQLWWDLPAMDGFILNKEIYEVDDNDFKFLINELAELLEVKDLLKIPVRKLSLGQRMKCELMASLIHRPKVLFLDEPTIGLDIVVQKRIREFFNYYNQKSKTTVLLTSHYMEDVAELCKRVIIINHGSKIYDGTLEELTRKYANNKYLKLIFNRPVELADLAKFGEVIERDKDGLKGTISVSRESHTKVASGLLESLPVDDLDISEVELEDIVTKIFQER
ncbi:MAG: ATP-binding cassette domain-containing protein [Candidatus Doudnabacteria bacterium]|nr:ATP-binding cassette domain-containing protein [Candidatus Doudnabacteria bacterium]